MRLTIDHDRCAGHGRCYELAPALLEPDDEGHAVVISSGPLPEDDERAAILAAENCPERALSVDR